MASSRRRTTRRRIVRRSSAGPAELCHSPFFFVVVVVVAAASRFIHHCRCRCCCCCAIRKLENTQLPPWNTPPPPPSAPDTYKRPGKRRSRDTDPRTQTAPSNEWARNYWPTDGRHQRPTDQRASPTDGRPFVTTPVWSSWHWSRRLYVMIGGIILPAHHQAACLHHQRA